jgi:outer membrane protein TolC
MLAWPFAFAETKQANQARQLDDLLKDRQATLRQLVEFVTEEYRNGTTGFDTVVRATDQVLDADLELAKNAEARIAILQKRVELRNSLFSLVETRFKAGQVTQAQVLAAKAAMLESEIRLAREQADAGKPSQ